MAKTLVYQLYLFGFLREGGSSAISLATKHLGRVKALGANVVWIGPIFPSPWYDHGYDVADHLAIEPRFGTMEEFDNFIIEAKWLNLKVIIDLIPGHTSTSHRWFKNPKTRKKFYAWSEYDLPYWKNLFDGGSSWAYQEEIGEYYLHLFHPEQADLNWFPNGTKGGINQKLVNRFRRIIDFWTQEHDIDGFRIDIPQSINKDLDARKLEFTDLLKGDLSIRVLNSLFDNTDHFLMMECFDPTFGEITEYYLNNTPVNFVLNVLLKDEIVKGEERFLDLVRQQANNPGFMLDLESHDSPRFISRGVTPEDMIYYTFGTNVPAICLYQGQELALDNPPKELLSNQKLLQLDAQTKMRFERGELLDDLRSSSRANARLPLPMDEYARQENNPSSYLNLVKNWSRRWRNR